MLVLVAVIDVFDKDVLFAVKHDVAEFVEKSEPERLTVFETVMQLDNRNILVPTSHAVNRCRLKILRIQNLNAERCAKFLQLVQDYLQQIPKAEMIRKVLEAEVL